LEILGLSSIRRDIAVINSFERRGTPEVVTNIIMFLASDASRFITGQTVGLGSGWVMK
jgi:NAD(P)-dependent dehydrogenase (short-subunit alcohol dehydrogenase family)